MTTPEERKMSDENELPKCPFCGGEASYTDAVGIGVTTNRYGLCSCADTQCLPEKIIFKVEKWRTRPIEDALRAEIERLKEAIRASEFADTGGLDGPGYCSSCGCRGYHDGDCIVGKVCTP